MTIETPEDLHGLRTISRVVSSVLAAMAEAIRPGVSTRELDDIGRNALDSSGARSAPELCYGFPGATCISVNSTVAHGIPGSYRLAPGDMVNIDVSAELNGYFSDTGATFCVPPVPPEKHRLCSAAREALAHAISGIRAGQPINVVGRRFGEIAARHGFTIIRNLGSHGVGRALHEEPTYIAPFHDPRDTRLFHEGMVVTIEPFLSNGAFQTVDASDGWGLTIGESQYAAQYEHTIVVTATGTEVLTSLPPV